MSARILRAEEPKLVVDVDAYLLLALAAPAALWWTSGSIPTDGGM